MYREWSTVWLEQPIVVRVWYYNDLFFRSKEELWISDLLVDQNKTCSLWPFISERLAAPVSIAGRAHHLAASLSYTDKTYCNISIDGEVIGGDVDIKIPRTYLETWPEIRRRGFLHLLFEIVYFARFNVGVRATLCIFFLFVISVLYYFTQAVHLSWEFTLSLLLQSTAIVMLGVLPGGLVIVFTRWRMWEKLYALIHQRKLDAPPVCLETDQQLGTVNI
jgi:hypothetical protein